ncbi:MAG: dienelactone hydrolase family protein [Alphaproteobacteria bacterium]|nr:MAG: dienelactone hydrolase family protein [Alphaproteobacteria bacterium]
MRKIWVIFCLGFLMLALPAHAEIITKSVDYTDGKTELRGTLVYNDEISSLRPGVLLVPEWWGHNDYIKRRAREMAEHGYVAFAIDMYGPDKVTANPKIAQEWAGPFYQDRKMMRQRARAGLAVLQKQVNVDKNNIAAVGFCMGGTVALELARDGEKLASVGAFHAGLQFPDPVAKGAVKAKIMVLNGAADPMVPFKDRQAFIEDMQKAGADLQFIEYSGAVHAFTNPMADVIRKAGLEGVGYNPVAEKRSFAALYPFLQESFGMKVN